MDEADELRREEELRAQGLLRKVEFGLRVKDFLNGPIAFRIKQEANAELAELANGLLDVDTDTPEGRDEARKMRLRAAVLKQWEAYLLEFVEEGRQAEVAYEEGEVPAELPT